MPRDKENPISRVTNLTQEEVRNRLNKIKIDESLGPDGIRRVLRGLNDAKLCKAVNTGEDSILLQMDLDKLETWAEMWQMQFNNDKCKVIHMGRRNQYHPYTLNGKPLSKSDMEKDLGILVNDKLTWNSQCQAAAAKANRIMGCIKRGPVAPVAQVTVSLNGNAVLPCTYSGKTTKMCWGRGRCPHFRCKDEIIKTDGQRVTWRKSDRYQLSRYFNLGDLSLTITGVTKKDEGTYCCRVQITGIRNDQKTEVKVTIREAHRGSQSVTTATTDHRPVTAEEDMFSMQHEVNARYGKVKFYHSSTGSQDVRTVSDSHGISEVKGVESYQWQTTGTFGWFRTQV
ncbi:unnamed protein product [Ranitomeya imitator]|uniref:Ig-like domain-containing protein n=1 Tax=Ranitomeya imitator TaxID=111125 RepID=A0ABN9M723_9NEOB|nr:unnamed protein product [Ranitomeya imitator]